MRLTTIIALALLILAAKGAIQAQAKDHHSGPSVTISKQRSFLDPGTVVPPRTSAYYETSLLYASSFKSENYSGVVGFERHPLPGPFDLPGARPLTVDFGAPLGY